MEKKTKTMIRELVNTYLYNIPEIEASICQMEKLHIEYNTFYAHSPKSALVNKLFTDYNLMCKFFVGNHKFMIDEEIENCLDALNTIRYKLLCNTPKGCKIVAQNYKGEYKKSSYRTRIDDTIYPVVSYRSIGHEIIKYIPGLLFCLIISLGLIVALFYSITNFENSGNMIQHIVLILIFIIIYGLLITPFLSAFIVFSNKVLRLSTIRKFKHKVAFISIFGVSVSLLVYAVTFIASLIAGQ